MKGEPEMCLSANLTVMLYSPGAVGRYVTVQVPSPLSVHLISVFDGPSIARDRPPVEKDNKIGLSISFVVITCQENA